MVYQSYGQNSAQPRWALVTKVNNSKAALSRVGSGWKKPHTYSAPGGKKKIPAFIYPLSSPFTLNSMTVGLTCLRNLDKRQFSPVCRF